MRTLALIPARAGSKGILGKNLRPFCGVSLIQRAQAIAFQTCDEHLVTTDIEGVGGCYVVRRPDSLCQDDTPMLAVVQHALTFVPDPPDVIVLLQPTQPLRTKQHVIDALKLLEETGADSVVSVVQIPAHYSPDYALRIDYGELLPVLGDKYRLPAMDQTPQRRQDCEPAYSRDGTVYAIKRETIENGSLYGSHCVPLVIPSHESVNLDTEDDWIRAEAMVKR